MEAGQLTALLDQSISGFVVYESIRDTNRQLTDFRLTYLNDAALPALRALVPDLPRAEFIGRSLRSLYPATDTLGQFARYAQVVETGESFRTEHYYADLGRWYEVAVGQLNDGFLINFIDVTHRKATEADLRAALASIQGVMDASPSYVVYYEPVREPETGPITDFTYVLVNQRLCDWLEQPRERIIGRRMSEFFPSAKPIGLFDRYVHVVETGQPTTFEFHYAADGVDGWFDITATPLRSGFVLSFLDITARQRAEQTMRQQADALQGILDSAPTAIMFFRAVRDAGQIIDFEWVNVNRKTAEITGLSTDQLLGNRLLTVHPYNKPYGLFDRYVHVVETGQPTTFEFHYAADGVDGWFDITAARRDDGLLLTILDSTARKRAELELVRQSDLLRATLDASLNSILSMTAIRNDAGEIVDFLMQTANQAVERSLFMKPDQLEGRRLLDVFPGNIESGLFAMYARVTNTGRAEQTVQYYSDVHGLEAWFEVSAVRQRPDDSAPDGVVLTFINITEAKQAEQQRERLVQELTRSNENLQSFAYVASHDLQEPLRKIQAFGDLLRQQYGPQLADGAGLIERMQAAAGRMQTLIRDLLALSRLTTRQQPFRDLDLNHVVADVLSDLEAVIAETGATVDVGELPAVSGDAVQLRQLVQNLLSNALKFVRPGELPRIQLTSQRLPGHALPPEVTTLLPANQPYYVLDVTDNGIGFDAERYRDKIFGAFQRLHGREQYAGTGIGLAVVKKVVENHAGAITVDSQLGRGATFRVYLPARRAT